jgi:hypothetical protein
MKIRIILTLVIIGVGVAVMYWLEPILGGPAAISAASLFVLFALSIWTLPASTFQRDTYMDPMQRRLVYGFLGVGLGMFGGLAFATLIPRPYNWIVLGVVAVAVTIWYYRK